MRGLWGVSCQGQQIGGRKLPHDLYCGIPCRCPCLLSEASHVKPRTIVGKFLQIFFYRRIRFVIFHRNTFRKTGSEKGFVIYLFAPQLKPFRFRDIHILKMGKLKTKDIDKSEKVAYSV